MPTTRMPSNPTSRSLRLGGLAAALGLFSALAQESLLAGATNSFFQNAATQTQGNYSTGSAPNKTNAYSGAGTVTLAGSSANTFTGITTVSEGTLQLNKTADTDAIAGDIEVNSDAFLLLSASGNVADAAEVTLSGGTITRGAGVSETFGALNLSAASTLDFGLGATGNLNFGIYEENAAPSALLTLQNFIPGNSFTFINANFSEASINSYFTFGSGFVNRSIIDNGSSSFTITAIPEPSTYVAAAGLLALFLWPARRRLIKDAKSILGLRPNGRDRIESYRSA